MPYSADCRSADCRKGVSDLADCRSADCRKTEKTNFERTGMGMVGQMISQLLTSNFSCCGRIFGTDCPRTLLTANLRILQTIQNLAKEDRS